MERRESQRSNSQSLWKPFLLTILFGLLLSLIMTALLVLIRLGLPALRAASFVETNCTTCSVESLMPFSCTYDCGDDFVPCEKHFTCHQVFANTRLQQAEAPPPLLVWDIDAVTANSMQCSNYPNCKFRMIIELYGRLGVEYKCYYDNSRPDIVLLQRPPNPLPYLIVPALVAFASLVLVAVLLYRHCRRSTNQLQSVCDNTECRQNNLKLEIKPYQCTAV